MPQMWGVVDHSNVGSSSPTRGAAQRFNAKRPPSTPRRPASSGDNPAKGCQRATLVVGAAPVNPTSAAPLLVAHAKRPPQTWGERGPFRCRYVPVGSENAAPSAESPAALIGGIRSRITVSVRITATGEGVGPLVLLLALFED